MAGIFDASSFHGLSTSGLGGLSLGKGFVAIGGDMVFTALGTSVTASGGRPQSTPHRAYALGVVGTSATKAITPQIT